MKRLLAAALILATTVLLIPAVEATVAGAETCPAVQNFAVGGTGDSGGVFTPGVPAGPRTNIVYPASISPVGGFVSGDESVRVGTAALSRAVDGFRAQCPNSQVNIVGFSLGAVVVSDVCDRLDGRNTTCYTYGNPKKPVTGAFSNLPSFIPGFTFDGPRLAPAGSPVVVERCNPRDLYCNGGNPLADPGHFIDSAIGTYLQGQHDYSAPVLGPVIPSTPTGVDVSPRAVEPVVVAAVPDAPIRVGGPYVPTPVGDYLPPAVRDVLPREIVGFIPPPIVLPPLPTF